MTGSIFHIQKFCLQDGPGIRTTVFFCGCPLQCRWCSNPESQNRYRARAAAAQLQVGKCMTVEEIMAEVRKDVDFYLQSGGGMTLSGGEILQQAEFGAELCEAAKAEGIHTAVETTGFGSEARFQTLIRHVDLLLFDLKHVDQQAHLWGTGVDNTIIVHNLRLALEQGKNVIGRIPVIPGFNDTLETAQKLAELAADVGLEEIHLLPFHQFGEKKYAQLGVPYAMEGVAQLDHGELEAYCHAFVSCGLKCTIQ